ncbi:hypothetical protein Anapl_01233 [Anas platyrhynchos]|uniref:Uncharacterized protein n=1 Tax=Anas platyrhynchos TaxID=8839 RepID=R0LKI3_ANAPL|nr:hypothetical protein Anapl_01233 [Anas platyrhynchos]
MQLHSSEDGAYADGEVSLLVQLHQPQNKSLRELSSAGFWQHSNVKREQTAEVATVFLALAGPSALHGDRHGAASTASSAADARQVDKRRFHSGSGSPEVSSVNFIRQAAWLGSPSKAPIDHLKHEEPQPAGDLACRLCPATRISRLTVKCFSAALPGHVKSEEDSGAVSDHGGDSGNRILGFIPKVQVARLSPRTRFRLPEDPAFYGKSLERPFVKLTVPQHRETQEGLDYNGG